MIKATKNDCHDSPFTLEMQEDVDIDLIKLLVQNRAEVKKNLVGSTLIVNYFMRNRRA